MNESYLLTCNASTSIDATIFLEIFQTIEDVYSDKIFGTKTCFLGASL